MTPSLVGRLQTRFVLMAVIGLMWTVLFGAAVFDSLVDGFVGLGILTALGLAWEVIYQSWQQKRFDKDWPPIFQLMAFVPEAIVGWPVLGLAGVQPASMPSYFWYFGGLWLIVWLVMQGPLKVLAPRWRYAGSRILARSHLRPVEDRERRPAAKPAPVHHAPARPRTGLRALPVSLGVVAVACAGVAAYEFTGGRLPEPMPTAQSSASPVKLPAENVGGLKGSTHWNKKKHVKPSALVISQLGVRSGLSTVGLRPDQSIDLPTDVSRAAWYKLGVAPGELGPAVIVGHIDHSGVFAKLAQLKSGSKISVARADGSIVQYRVTKVAKVATKNFPTKKVYGYVNRPELRIVGTDVDAAQNVIVNATAKSLVKAKK